MKEEDLALTKAINSGDTNLGLFIYLLRCSRAPTCEIRSAHTSVFGHFDLCIVYVAILSLKERRNRGEFLRIMDQKPQAVTLLLQVLLVF